jgi:hypothetical protein
MATNRSNRLIVNPVPPQLLNAVWQDVVPLLSAALDNSENELDIPYVRDRCLDGTFDLWITTRGKKLVGFMMTEQILTVKGVWVNIPLAGFAKDLQAMNTSLARLEEVAKLTGFKGVKYISKDRRFGTYADRRGYRERYREYVKEF